MGRSVPLHVLPRQAHRQGLRTQQNFNICNSIRRHCSTNNIKRIVEPGGSTLSRSIFAFLENWDNTNVDSNPTKTSMNLKNSAQGKFSNWPNASPLAAWRLRTLGPQQTERGTSGANARGLQVHQEGERLEDGQLSLKHQHRRSRRSLASAFLLGSLPCPPAPRRLAVPASFAFSRLTCWILV